MSVSARVTAVAVVLVGLALPSSAHAAKKTWWDFLEELSGPGRWQGIMLDTKLFCFGKLRDREPERTEKDREKERSLVQAVNDALAEAKTLTRTAIELKPPPPFAEEMRTSLRSMDVRIESIEDVEPLRSLSFGTGKQIVWAKWASGLCSVGDTGCSHLWKTVGDAWVVLNDEIQELESTVGGGAVGLALSACGNSREVKRNSIDLGVRLMSFQDQGQDDPWAGGNTMRLVTLVPSYTWRVFKPKNLDFMTLGVGAGVYWITSDDDKDPARGFDPLTGVIVEPLKVTMHVPHELEIGPCWEWLKVIQLRAGFVVFPRGFKANAFGPGSVDKRKRIGAESVPYYGAFVDLDFLIQKINR